MPAKRNGAKVKRASTTTTEANEDEKTDSVGRPLDKTPSKPGTSTTHKVDASNPGDPRILAFLKPTNAFASSQYASSVFEIDPYDVESLHAETHAIFAQMVERATTSAAGNNRGRTLLVLGDSGTGKTHLLRGFRRHVQENAHGLAAYAQLNSNSNDYARYLLQNVIASLSKPYSIPSGKKTGLNQLANGLALLAGGSLKQDILHLAEDDWSDKNRNNLHEHINHLVDGLLTRPELSTYDPDLLRILLYTLCPEQAIVPRLYKYLSCEPMTEHDRQWIGGITPHIDADAPARMIRDLANLAYNTQNWCFVLMLDQAEAAGQEASSGLAFRRAFDTLYSIVNMVPSAIAIIACLSDLYYDVRNHLTRFSIDRLERDPGIQRLRLNRSYEEIQAIVGQRLSRIFDESGVVHRPSPATFPFPEGDLRALEGYRTRDVLEWCQEFQTKCALEERILSNETAEVGLPGGVTRDTILDEIATSWNDAISASGIEIPEDDDRILSTLIEAASACATENRLEITITTKKDDATHVQLAGSRSSTELKFAVTNKSYRGGGFGSQIDSLRERVGDFIPVAIRTLPSPQGPASERAIEKLTKGGGRYVYLDASTLRTLVAMSTFEPPFPLDRIDEWRRRDRPISTLPTMRQIFDLDQLSALPKSSQATTTANREAGAAEPPMPEAQAEEPPPPKKARAKTRKASASAAKG